jgi:homoserine/homoserine lactone efflux protein
VTWSVWALFAVTEASLSLVPGPAVLLVVAQGLAQGTRASIFSNVGILAGNTVYFVLSATGLGLVLLASYDLFFAIKWIGAAYLVWLGVVALVAKPSSRAALPEARRSGALRLFANGIVVQLANPKALLFFTALLPQFIDSAEPLWPQVSILAITSVVIEFFVLLAYGAIAGKASLLAAGPTMTRWVNRASGSLLIAAGLGMAALRRN